MPAQIASSILSQLEALVRNGLMDWASTFEFEWRQGQLESYLATLPADLKPWRKEALAELVRIELSQLWQADQRVRLESYLDRFHELGDAQTVSAELVIAEIEARQAMGETVSGDKIVLRFPKQAAVVRERLRDSSQVVKPRRREQSAMQPPPSSSLRSEEPVR